MEQSNIVVRLIQKTNSPIQVDNDLEEDLEAIDQGSDSEEVQDNKHKLSQVSQEDREELIQKNKSKLEKLLA